MAHARRFGNINFKKDGRIFWPVPCIRPFPLTINIPLPRGVVTVKAKKKSKDGQTSLEITIAVVAILVMVLETLIGAKGMPFFFK